jgi:hypothetical protein
VLTVFGFLLRDEHATGSSITQAYSGGAYEIAVFGPLGFKKISEITYVLWRIDVIDGEVEIIAPYLIMKQFYVGEVLIINCARWEGESAQHNPGVLIYKLATHAIFPPYKLDGVPQLPVPQSIGFDSSITVQCMLVVSGDEEGILHFVSTGAPGFKYKIVDGKGEMTMSDDTIAEIRSTVLQGFAN